MSSKEIPITLKLGFSEIADFERISRMFEPDVKSVIDPDNYVTKRLDSVFRKSVDSGSVAFLSDENGNIKTMTVAYHAYIEKKPTPDARHDYTELGSAFSLIPGYKSSLPIISTLVLREWFNKPPTQKIADNIEPDTVVAIKVF